MIIHFVKIMYVIIDLSQFVVPVFYQYDHTFVIVPYCPAVTPPPPFCDLLSGKRGGGRNNEDLRFRLAFKPPPLPRIRVLCSVVEDENSFARHAVAVLKDGRVVGHVHVAKHSR